MILTSNLAWLHYYVLLIPMSLYLIRPAQENDGRAAAPLWKRLAAMGALLLLSTTAGSLVQDDTAYATIVNAAAVMMTALMFLELWAKRSARLPRYAGLGQNLPRHRVA